MLTINTYNFGNDNEPLLINPKLLAHYKEECDIYLVDVKRQLTRSLVDYRIFQKLQDVYNYYYVIIRKLEEQEYTNINQMEDDKKYLRGLVVAFQKECKPAVSTSIYTDIMSNCNKVMLTLIKLIKIVKDVNTNNDDNMFKGVYY